MTSLVAVEKKSQRHRHRHKGQLIFEMLSYISENEPLGVGKTRLMFHTMTSSRVNANYIAYMLANGLLTMDKSKHITYKSKPITAYHVTDKARIFLKLYDNMQVLAGDDRIFV